MARPHSPSPPSPGAEAPRVLVVDDDVSSRVIAALMLETVGCSPTVVGSVERALDRVQSQGTDLVLTDLVMPGRTGLDLLESLRWRTPLLPVIVMTGTQDEALLGRARELGASSILLKPFSARRLEEAVRDALAGAIAVETPAAA